MNRASTKVFDDYIHAQSAATAYTSSKYNGMLGLYDQLAIQVVVDDVPINGTITVDVEHSGDNINFVPVSSTPPIAAKDILSQFKSVYAGFVAGMAPTLRYVRLAISLGGPTPKARVRVFVTMRDQGVAEDIRVIEQQTRQEQG